jgi:hypothetical protein
MHIATRLLLLCVLAAPASGWSRERLDADTMVRYGGTYSVACGNPSMARLRVLPDALLVELGNQRMTGLDPQAVYSYFGQSPPKAFQVALLSQVRGMSELIFIVSRDRVGSYVEIDGSQNVRAALGPSLTGRRYRQCEGAAVAAAGGAPQPGVVRPAAPPPPSPASPPPSAAGSVNAAVLIADPRFGKTWRSMLGGAREPWLAEMDGPAPEPRWVTIGGNRYVLNAFCKAHDCYDNNVVQLYSPGEPRIFAFIHRVNRDTLLGDPPPAMAAELRRLWQGEFRKSR